MEFVDGEIVEKPMGAEERRVTTIVSALLYQAAKATKAGEVMTEVGFRCFPDEPARFRKPDVCFVRAEKLPKSLKGIDLFDFPPDLAVEVISPNDAAVDVEEKVQEYLAAGFPVVWVVYPSTKTVFVRRTDRKNAELHAEDEITGEDFLPGFKCKVGAFFE